MITIMKKLNLLIAASALAAMVSCSNDEVVVQPNNAPGITNQAIGFSPLSRAVSRSTVLSQTADMSSFRVMGFWEAAAPSTVYIKADKKTYDTAPAKDAAYEDFGTITVNGQTGIEIVQSSTGTWDYKNSSEIQYWPFSATTTGSGDAEKITGYDCQNLYFRAVTPANTALSLKDEDDAAKVPFEYTTPTSVSDMTDICYAKADATTNAKGAVELKFGHLLSQIVFNAKKPSNYDVDIKEVTINGAKDKGKYSNLNELTTSTQADVTVDGSTAKAYPGFTTAGDITLSDLADSAKTEQITPAKQELLLLPQDIAKWESGKATASSDGWIKVVYRARVKGSATWATAGDAGDYAEVYFPFSAKWVAGKKYIYTLLFAGAKDPDSGKGNDDDDNPDPTDPKDEDGNAKAQAIPITFTASVNDWEESVVDVKF